MQLAAVTAKNVNYMHHTTYHNSINCVLLFVHAFLFLAACFILIPVTQYGNYCDKNTASTCILKKKICCCTYILQNSIGHFKLDD